MTTAAEAYELVGNALCLDFANTVNQRSDPRRDWLTEPDGLHRWARHAGLLPDLPKLATGKPGTSATVTSATGKSATGKSATGKSATGRSAQRGAGKASGTDAEREWSGVDAEGEWAGVDAAGLRDAVYLTFSAIAAGREPDPSDLAVITVVAGEGLAAAQLVRDIPHRSSVLSDHPDGARRTAYGQADGSVGGLATYGLDWTQAGERAVVWAVADSAVELLRHGPLDRVGECPSCGWVFLDTSRNGRRRWCSMAMCGGAVKSARHYARRDRTGR